MTMNDLSLFNLLALALLTLVVLRNHQNRTTARLGDRGCPGPVGPMGLRGLPGKDGQDGKDGKDGDNSDANHQDYWRAEVVVPVPAPTPTPAPTRRFRCKYTRRGIQICLTKGSELLLFESCVAADRFLIQRELSTRIGCVQEKLLVKKPMKQMIGGYFIHRVNPQQSL